jgi:outer membrane protein TolC
LIGTLALTGLLAATPSLPAVSDDHGLSLDEARTIALDHNASVRDALVKVRIAEVMVDEAKAGWLPQLSLSTSAGPTNNLLAELPPGTHLSNRNLSSVLGAQNLSVSTGFTLTQPLVDWQAGPANDQARMEAEIARELYRAACQEAASNVEQAYQTLVAAREQLPLKEKARNLAAEHLKATRKSAERGMTRPIDVLQAETKALTAEADCRQAARAARKAEASLAILLGWSPDRPVTLADQVAHPLEVPVFKVCLDRALAQRPDVRVARVQADEEALKRRTASHALWPSIGLQASAAEIGTSTFAGVGTLGNSLQPDISIMAVVSWNLFDGGKSDAEYRRAGLSADHQMAMRDATVRQAMADVEEARDGLLEAQERQDLAFREYDLADRTYSLAASRLRRGLATPLDLQDAELALLQAEVATYQASEAVAIAQAKFQRALGEDPPERPAGAVLRND